MIGGINLRLEDFFEWESKEGKKKKKRSRKGTPKRKKTETEHLYQSSGITFCSSLTDRGSHVSVCEEEELMATKGKRYDAGILRSLVAILNDCIEEKNLSF